MKKTLYSLLIPCLLTTGWLLAASGHANACNVTVTDTAIKASCNGLPNGSVTLTHDGTAPFTYAWSHDANLNAPTATGLVNGNLTVTVTDAAGCTAVVNLVIPLLAGPQVFASPVSDTCQLGRGKVVAAVVGGKAPLTFVWDDPLKQANDTAFNLTPGNYTVIVADANTCADTALVVLTSKDDALSGSIAVENTKCFQQADGTAKAIAQGVTGPWTYSWLNRTEVTDSISGLLAGQYTCTIALGACTTTITASVSEPAVLQSALFVVQRPGCNTTDGIYRAVAAGGTAPYRFVWETTPQQANDTVFGVPAGAIFFTVTDTNNCSLRQEFIVETNNGPSLTIEHLRADYCDKREGVVRVRTAGGKAPFSYEWRSFGVLTPDTSEFIYNRYYKELLNVVVKDADSCVHQISTVVPGTYRVKISSFSKEEEYCELVNGKASALVDPATGTPPYTYFWNTTPVQQGIDYTTADSLIHGSYRLIVADSNNCRDSVEFTIQSTPAFTLSALPTDATCSNSADGALNILALNAPSAINYVWADDPLVTGPSRAGLNPGNYVVTATDSRNCMRSIVGVVGGPPPLLPDFTSQALPEDTIPLGIPINFYEESEGEEFYLWDFGNDSVSAEANPIYTYPDTGTYMVKLTVVNNGGRCIRDTTIGPYYIIPRSMVVMPNAFTPNNDVGQVNETFGPVYKELDTLHMVIFNRYGKKVFETSGVQDAWDGKLDGTPAPEGEYTYLVFAIGLDKIKYDLYGRFLLIR